MSLLHLPAVIEHMAQDDKSKFVRILVGLTKLAGIVFVVGVAYSMYTGTYTLGQYGDALFRFSFLFLLLATAIIGIRAVSRSENISLKRVALKLLVLFLGIPILVAMLLLLTLWIFNPQQ